MLKIDEVMEELSIHTAGQIGGQNIFSLSNDNFTLCGQSLFQAKPYYYNGDCYAMNMPKCLLDSGILEVALFFKMKKVDIFIHHPGQYLSPNSK